MTPEQLDKLDADMSEDNRERLIRLRGGCSCFQSPPCNNHVDPLTEEEAEDLGLLDEAPAIAMPAEVWCTQSTTPADYMKAVRDLCKGV